MQFLLSVYFVSDISVHIFLSNRAESIRRLCEKFRVRRLSAFGSVCTENFTEKSDVDFLYLFDMKIAIESINEFVADID